MKIVLRDIDTIHPYELNAKLHPPEQVKKIAASLALGWDQPIVVDKAGVIIKGHGRRLAAISMGMKQVPVLVRDDLDEDQVRAARLADNRAGLSNIDGDILKQELESLNYDLSNVFDKKELDYFVADLGAVDLTTFSSDIDDAIETHDAALEDKADAAMEKRVSISKALGFKDVEAVDQIHLTKFMAAIEEKTGKKGDGAFVQFARDFG